ncbi:hypothetical protein LOK49_LG09G00889 [Camellia lanceoleosa]|uniref:Uncharacterized protein n=1 Tax=Camellia lanceoleosa TaxID=1840588 RepID=A0ACC0GHV3_9ERIC|nr:hypothetical protein LOK49_LG09G00889 [Camellia lanceoleosa]
MPQDLDWGKIRIITKCMEPINQVILLETKQSSYPMRVWEDQVAVPTSFNHCCCCKKHQPMEEDHSSIKVRGTKEKDDSNGAGDGEPSQNHIVESTQHLRGELA